MTPCTLIGGYQNFRGTCLLYLRGTLKSGRWLLTFEGTMCLQLQTVLKEAIGSPAMLVTTTGLHGVITLQIPPPKKNSVALVR
jgi:hypothetical protein